MNVLLRYVDGPRKGMAIQVSENLWVGLEIAIEPHERGPGCPSSYIILRRSASGIFEAYLKTEINS